MLAVFLMQKVTIFAVAGGTSLLLIGLTSRAGEVPPRRIVRPLPTLAAQWDCLYVPAGAKCPLPDLHRL